MPQTFSSMFSAVWKGGSGSPHNVEFLAAPVAVPTAALSANPWSRPGLSPYESYFSEFSDYVSPGNGLVSVEAGTLYLPGRGPSCFGLLRGCVQSGIIIVLRGGIEMNQDDDENDKELAGLSKLVSKKKPNLPLEPLRPREASALLKYIDALEAEAKARVEGKSESAREPYSDDLKSGLNKLVGIVAKPSESGNRKGTERNRTSHRKDEGSNTSGK
ncbi:MAG: hypothetical protein JRM99_06425 [Nitrososphaerota archaeon]|nr:hypothetical protein [Nitrososphaerota archaeon]